MLEGFGEVRLSHSEEVVMKRLIAAVAALFSLTACGTAGRSEALLRLPGHGRHFERQPIPLAELPQHFSLVRDMAVLSELAYQRESGDIQTKRSLELEPSIRTNADAALANDPDPDRKQAHRAVGRLEYDVFVDRTSTPKLAVIAFRGTDSKIDHFSNFRWFTLWIPHVKDQYEQTELIVPKLVEQIHTQVADDAVIIATGHSLGGGLAQTAGYVACHDIAAVYAFDPSPVTHHHASQPGRGPCPSDRPVYRIYEDTEILALSRLPLRFAIGLSDANPRITEAKVHLLSGRLGGHSMTKLAQAFVANFP